MGKHDRERGPSIEQVARNGQPCIAVCGGKHCARAGGGMILQAAEAALHEADLTQAVTVVQTRCQDFCDDGPVLTLVPGMYPYLHLCPVSTRQIVLDHVRDGNPVLDKLHRRMRKRLARKLDLD
ncbi:ferredoxin [Candidatus Chloroploca sp. Khr17]|uniref:(2Fe-2S) ferredoxin domain-containing protein n=1 Tax=Candidatus Chloroploca sp. Khr17 TaxID=2496869 RepID=UPI00101BEF69|nr:(2Fe-2S) ferredoxin domain-containing protein [Candidatus Chloroploca sp. Khr17]